MCKSVYIAATSQNDGKTTVSIGLLNKFLEKYQSVGFIKPVGQQFIDINNNKVDKDTILINDIYSFSDNIKDMSPIAVQRGFTENYIKNREKLQQGLRQKILDSYEKISKGKKIVVIEGTGHAGVGSVFDLNNAQTAKLLKSKVIIVSKGGIGRSIDEIYMNKVLFEKEGVEIVGVIMNHVLNEKYDKIKEVVKMSLDNMGLKLLGVIPECKILSAPTMFQIKEHLNGELINGDNLHENILQVVVGAMTPNHALNYIKRGTLIITPGDREDLILASLSTGLEKHNSKYCISGLILTEGIRPHKNIFKLIEKTNIPVITVNEETYRAASQVHDLLVKIMYEDKEKIKVAKELIEDYVDVDFIVNAI